MTAGRSVTARSALVLAATVVAMSAAPAAHLQAATRLPPLSHVGRWLTDGDGRVIVLHGLQVDKFEPTKAISFIDLAPGNVRFMADEGFNLARVSLAYAGVEPRLGQFDDAYVDSYRAFDEQLASAGVYDLVDMMQGEYSIPLGGFGFPDWMTQTDALPNTGTPFPLGYLDNPAEQRAWDHLFADTPAADGVGLTNHYAAGLRHIAGRFGDAPGLLGFEILNEPWPGSQWPACANPAGCPPVVGFDQTSLTAFYGRIIPALRSADPARHLIFYEPNLLFDFGAATGLGSTGDPNTVFAFHNYCLGTAPGFPPFDPGHDCGIDEKLVLSNAEARTHTTGDGLLMDEWGNTADTSVIQRMTTEADQTMVGWSYWALEDCCGSPGAVIKDGTRPATMPGNLNTPVLDALVRAYPQAIAGTPTGWSYDAGARVFHLGYTTTLVDGRNGSGRLTEVFVPSLHFGGAYGVTLHGAEVAGGLGTQRLLVRNCAGAATVELTVTAAASTVPASCATQAAAGGASTGRPSLVPTPDTASSPPLAVPNAIVLFLVGLAGLVRWTGRRPRLTTDL